MNIGISSATFYPMYTEQAIDQIIDLGFQNAEIFINCEREFENKFIKRIKRKLDEGGVQVVSVHPYTSVIEAMYFFSEYDRRFEDGLEIYRRYFEAAAQLGAKYFTFHGDRNIVGGSKDMQVSMKRHYEVLRRLGMTAKEFGITLTQENVSWCLSSSLEYIQSLRESLGKDIAFTLDVKQAVRMNINPKKYINAMGDRLVNIHISDHTTEKNCLLPGEGEMDFADFVETIKKINYNGSLIIEVYSGDFDDVRQIELSKLSLEHHIYG